MPEVGKLYVSNALFSRSKFENDIREGQLFTVTSVIDKWDDAWFVECLCDGKVKEGFFKFHEWQELVEEVIDAA